MAKTEITIRLGDLQKRDGFKDDNKDNGNYHANYSNEHGEYKITMSTKKYYDLNTENATSTAITLTTTKVILTTTTITSTTTTITYIKNDKYSGDYEDNYNN